MSKRLEAVYENGVLRPLEPLGLSENQRVCIVLSENSTPVVEEDWLDIEYVRLCAEEADESVSLETVREVLSKIPGSLTSAFIDERRD